MSRMTCYPVSSGKWAAALRTGNVSTLIALFDTAREAVRYVVRCNEALERRGA